MVQKRSDGFWVIVSLAKNVETKINLKEPTMSLQVFTCIHCVYLFNWSLYVLEKKNHLLISDTLLSHVVVTSCPFYTFTKWTTGWSNSYICFFLCINGLIYISLNCFVACLQIYVLWFSLDVQVWSLCFRYYKIGFTWHLLPVKYLSSI